MTLSAPMRITGMTDEEKRAVGSRANLNDVTGSRILTPGAAAAFHSWHRLEALPVP